MDNGSIEYALAFSGTNMKDQNEVNTDILQAFGQYDTWEKLKESQFGIGLTVTNTLLQNNLGHELSIVGHSIEEIIKIFRKNTF